MLNRRKILIDKKFQLKSAFFVIGIVYFFIIIAVAGVIYTTILNNNKLSEVIDRQKYTVQLQKDVMDSLFVFSKDKNSRNIKAAMDNVSKDMTFNMSALDANMMTIDNISKNNIKLLYAVIIFFILQGVILYFVLIKSAHRIAGPIYHMSKYIRELINGKIPEVRPLRKKDELKDFHDLILQLVESFKQMQVKKNKK
jgi:hypothetical protein